MLNLSSISLKTMFKGPGNPYAWALSCEVIYKRSCKNDQFNKKSFYLLKMHFLWFQGEKLS